MLLNVTLIASCMNAFRLTALIASSTVNYRKSLLNRKAFPFVAYLPNADPGISFPANPWGFLGCAFHTHRIGFWAGKTCRIQSTRRWTVLLCLAHQLIIHSQLNFNSFSVRSLCFSTFFVRFSLCCFNLSFVVLPTAFGLESQTPIRYSSAMDFVYLRNLQRPRRSGVLC